MTFRVNYLLITAGLFAVEILIATVFAHITFVRSYLSDYLVVMLLYYLVKVFYDAPPLALSAGIFLFACGIEALQYFHFVDVLGVPRESLLGILLGSSFSWIDILMYFLGCLTVYFSSSTSRKGVSKNRP